MNEQDTSLRGFSWTLAAMELMGVVLLGLMGVWTGHYRGGFAWTEDLAHMFNWHPLFMTIGMIFLYGHGIVVYRVFRNERKETIKRLHAFLFGAAFVLTVIALVVVFDTHDLAKPPIPNLYTLHSWIGLIVVILFCCQWVSGFIAFLFPKLHYIWRSAYLPVHRYFGLAIFACAIIAALTGLLEKAHWALGKKYGELGGEAILINVMSLAMVFYGCLVIYLAGRQSYKRTALPSELPLSEGSVPPTE